MLSPSRPISNSLRQLNHPSPELSFYRHNCTILKVNYVSRRLKVSAHGYSGPKKVAVQLGIPLGTADNPIVTTSNVAEIERQADGSWLCIAILRKYKCASGTAPTIDVISDNEFDPFYSQQTDDFGSILTPDNLFMPPIESLGQLSLPADRFPGETTFLCGVPPCPDCAPDGFVVGMSPVYTAEGCWRWDFRGASCGLYFGSQGAYADYFPESDDRTQDQVVAVRENYVYIASVNLDGTFGYAPATLLTYDISTVTVPILVDAQTIPAGPDGGIFNLGISVREDVLWVSGTLMSAGLLVGDTVMYRYDISIRTTPAPVTSWLTRLFNNFTSYLHYDTVTETFTGQPYLVGFNWDYSSAANCAQTMIVEDGLVGGEVQVLSGFNFSKSPITSAFFSTETAPATVCDNTVLACYWESDGMGGHINHVLAVDFTNVPAGAITPIWNTLAQEPRAYLGGNHAYLITDQDSLYTQIDIDDTHIDLGVVLPTDNATIPSFGYFLKGNCLLRIGNFDFPQAWSANIFDQEVPINRSQVGLISITGGRATSGQYMSADILDGHVRLAMVGSQGNLAYLVVCFAP